MGLLAASVAAVPAATPFSPVTLALVNGTIWNVSKYYHEHVVGPGVEFNVVNGVKKIAPSFHDNFAGVVYALGKAATSIKADIRKLDHTLENGQAEKLRDVFNAVSWLAYSFEFIERGVSKELGKDLSPSVKHRGDMLAQGLRNIWDPLSIYAGSINEEDKAKYTDVIKLGGQVDGVVESIAQELPNLY